MIFSLRNKILIPLILVLLGMALAFIGIYQHEQQNKLNALQELTVTSVKAYYDSSISARTNKLEMLADEIVSDPVIGRELKARNRAALLALLKERYKSYNAIANVTHLYFHTPEGINLLRLHQPDRFGDRIDRFTMKESMATGQEAAGVELGVLGTLTLRVVRPVFHEGGLEGYIELGEEVGDIYEEIINKLDVGIYLLIKETLLSRNALPPFVDTKVSRGVVPNEALYEFRRNQIPSYLIKALAAGLEPNHKLVEQSYSETHLLGALPLMDAGGRDIGRIVIDKDVTTLVAGSQRSVALVSVAALALWSVASLTLYIVLGRLERRLNDSTAALYEKEATLANAQNIARLSSWTLNMRTQAIGCSIEFSELLGVDPRQAPVTLEELTAYIESGDRQPFVSYLDAAITGREGEELLHRVITVEGIHKWVKLRAARICTIDHRHEILHAVVQDVTEMHGAEIQATKLGSLLKYSWNEIYLFDAVTLKFTEVSEGALRNLGYGLEEMQALTPVDIKPGMDRQRFDAIAQRLRRGLTEQEVFETVHQRKDGSCYPVEVRLQYCRDVTPALYMAIIQDITERKRYIAELERKALYDELTGLPNRALLCDRLGEWIKQAARNHTVFTVLAVEINRIKEVDDVLGYETCDRLIKEVATRMVENLRQSDVVGYLGSGLFALLLPLAEDEKVRPVMEKLIRMLQVPVTIEGVSVDIDITIGAALYPRHGEEQMLLLRHADMALQHAKTELLNMAVYEDETHPLGLRRLQLIAELRQDIMNEKLVLFYQPKVNVATGVVESVEALLRWPRTKESQWIGKQDQWISPAEFVPLAEQTGLIYPLTALVLRQAVGQCRRWLDAGIDIKVAINLSARNLLDPELPALIRNVMADHGVPAKNITLEVTENMMMRQPERALEVLNQLHDQGLGVSIDDFGSGYSSLAYLKQLPVQELKIDQGFIRAMLVSDDDAVIVRSTIDLAHNLGLQVVAEGVENRDTWAALGSLGCDLIQGYFVSRPMSATYFEGWHQSHGGRFALT